MNSVVLIGRLARDPELSYTPNTQTAVCRMTVAVDKPRKQGEDQGADFIRVTVWDRQAENCDRYLSKGSQVAVRGRIETGSYTNREGQKVYTTEVVADRYNGVEFLGSRNGGSGGQSSGSNQGGQPTFAENESTAPVEDASPAGGAAPAEDFTGFDDMPDTFQAAEDDIPF